MRSIFLAVAFAIASSSGAFAQSSSNEGNTCSIAEELFEATKDILVGAWTVDAKWGILEGPGVSVPLPAPKEKDTVTMTMVYGKLMGTNSQVPSTYELRYHQDAEQANQLALGS